MRVFVFRGPTIAPGHAYGFTPDDSGANLPASFGPWSRHDQIDLLSGDPCRVSVNAGEALASISKQGFHIQGVTKWHSQLERQEYAVSGPSTA